jgi:ADP-heptose:LPS heptosyltransferase
MKFLVIRFSSIGDIVLTTPVVRCLKKQVAESEVHFLTKYNFKSIVENNPFIDKLHYLKEDLDDVIKILKEEQFDYIVDLHHNLRTLKVKKALAVPSYSFRKLNIEKWVLTTFKINLLPDMHIVDRYLDTVQSFEVDNDDAGLDYFIPQSDLIKEQDIPAGHLAGYIGIAIGAALNTKKFPVHKFREVCNGIDHPIILLGGKEDRENGENISLADRHKVYNACGKFNLNESADLVRRSKLLISNDTGLMHIATSFRKPVISIWGNTVPDFGMYPYYGKKFLDSYARSNQGRLPYDVIEVNDLYCRPCSKIGYKKCPLGHFKCMENIDVQHIVEAVKLRI